MVAGVGSVFHTVQAEAAIGVIAGEFGDGSADGHGVKRGNVEVVAAHTAAAEDFCPVMKVLAAFAVVVTDAGVGVGGFGHALVVIRAVAPLFDGVLGKRAAGGDAFAHRRLVAAACQGAFVERVFAVRALVRIQGGEFLRAQGGVGREAFVVTQWCETFFGAHLIDEGECFLGLFLDFDMRPGNGIRRQFDVADINGIDDLRRRRIRVVRCRFVRRQIVATTTATAGGEQGEGKDGCQGLGLHVFSCDWGKSV